ncbi:sulfurtransferase TusA [Entomomonas asaccharolytica]|uniref:Sulfur carrier protein TusA n=1 Tax=Entomomonas asaccharolytica TaxID=2785331 RepID=A0A974NGC8_9GAMM|nr:sulfurtransferase TusA [Entomomonas asaccharolytica]QQP86084.1 sulfurtransferase TusA [Entomomonas asaccharolytica]
MTQDTLQPDDILDATGLLCPEPIMLLHNKIRDLPVGGLLKIIATDPSTQRDIPKFCNFLEHQLIAQDNDETTYYYWIRKKANS